MEFVKRDIVPKLQDMVSHFPVVFLTGPRQSGKSTLLRHLYSGYRYVNLEEKDICDFALGDPRGFLNDFGGRLIIDEAQQAPELFSYIQARVDRQNQPGMYILSGSQNFVMLRSISQSLAGRVGILSLLPFSLGELAKAGRLPQTAKEWMFTGSYPRIFSAGIPPQDFFPSYITTYVERDVRAEINIHDLEKFRRFLAICAACTGSPVNLSKIGSDVSADARTIHSWLSILEESYIIFRLAPYYRNLGNRYVKTPKLYFYDTGLLCALLRFSHADELDLHEMKGHIFEAAVISEIAKQRFNAGKGPNLYYWRDSGSQNREIDLLEETAAGLVLTEIKSSQTANKDYVKNLLQYEAAEKRVIYDGPDIGCYSGVRFINWRSM
jgi:predicted AAA+ superfamily ATPase